MLRVCFHVSVRLLVVDDEPAMLTLVRRVFEREGGFEIDESGTGAEALERATLGDYDAIVLDVDIPPPDGLSVCRELRKRDIWTPVLILTGRGAVTDRVRGLEAGADDYLTKPFAGAELVARVRSLARRADREPDEEVRLPANPD